MIRGLLKFLGAAAALLWLSGCASYASRVRLPRAEYEAGQYDAAIKELTALADRHDNDELLYLLDLGMAYHTSGDYASAVKTFQRAEDFAERKDYTSISQEAGSVLLNDQVKVYKGEDFEKVLINVYKAIDYTMMNQWDDALVECRQVDRKIDMLISAGKIKYDKNPFAKYLAAALFEARGEYDDAFVDYRQLFDWIGGGFPYLGGPLLRMAIRAGDSEDFDDYRKKLGRVPPYKLGPNQGEVVVILEQGRAPLKMPSPNFRLIPVFRHRYYSSDYAWLDDNQTHDVARTDTLFDIERAAVQELDQKLNLIIAKKIGGMVVKGAVAYGVARATHSAALGYMTDWLLNAADEADLRSWTTLPAHLQIARFPVNAGRQDISLDMVGLSGAETPSVKKWTVDVKPGQMVFLDYRSRG